MSFSSLAVAVLVALLARTASKSAAPACATIASQRYLIASTSAWRICGASLSSRSAFSISAAAMGPER